MRDLIFTRSVRAIKQKPKTQIPAAIHQTMDEWFGQRALGRREVETAPLELWTRANPPLSGMQSLGLYERSLDYVSENFGVFGRKLTVSIWQAPTA
jgi:hypothetical protein